MSHIARIEIEITDLECLKQACKRQKLEFKEDQKTYQWYGSWIGNTPLPEGVTQDDLGKCDHAIKVPGADYEIGVFKNGNRYILLWDSYVNGGLTKILGKNAGRLKQAYALERVRKEARRKGYSIREKVLNKGVRIVLTV